MKNRSVTFLLLFRKFIPHNPNQLTQKLPVIVNPSKHLIRLDVVTLEQHLDTVFSIVINTEFKLQQYQVFS